MMVAVISCSGCSSKCIPESTSKHNVTQEFPSGEVSCAKNDETVSAEIVELNMKHWFAGTHRYQWYIKVYYEPYDLYYEENFWSTGAFNCPSLYESKIGDSIEVEILNEYTDNVLTNQEIIRIVN